MNLSQAKAWAEQARGTVQVAIDQLKSSFAEQEQRRECEATLAVILFNLGMVSEVRHRRGLSTSCMARLVLMTWMSFRLLDVQGT